MNEVEARDLLKMAADDPEFLKLLAEEFTALYSVAAVAPLAGANMSNELLNNLTWLEMVRARRLNYMAYG